MYKGIYNSNCQIFKISLFLSLMESSKAFDFNRDPFGNLQKESETGNENRKEKKIENGTETKKRKKEEEEGTFKIFQAIKDDREKNQEIFQTRSNIGGGDESGKTTAGNIKVFIYLNKIIWIL